MCPVSTGGGGGGAAPTLRGETLKPLWGPATEPCVPQAEEFERAAEVRDELRSTESTQDWEAAQRALTRGLEEQRRQLARLARDEARPRPRVCSPWRVSGLSSLDFLRAGPGILECRRD
jgi:hypothetical protein